MGIITCIELAYSAVDARLLHKEVLLVPGNEERDPLHQTGRNGASSGINGVPEIDTESQQSLLPQTSPLNTSDWAQMAPGGAADRNK